PKYKTITHRDQQRPENVPTVYVLTQERLLERQDIEDIDLLFVDEFYKLDPNRDDERADALNVALYKNIPKAKQVFMAGTHISSIMLGSKWNTFFKFIKSDFRTVSVNIIDRTGSDAHLAVFLGDLRTVGDQPSLVFTAHPWSAIELTREILNAKISYN